MARVVLRNLEKVYPDGFRAIKDFSLDIADHEFVVFVGPSGCGKSTTLRCIAGLEDATRGTIQVGGRVVNDVAPKDRDIAMVFQNYALYPHMTAFENMALGLKLRGVPKDVVRSKVAKAAKILGIEAILDRKPKTLSGGQRQRVAVGRAIVREPKAFLFDEPLSNLDAKLRVEMRSEIKRIHMELRSTTIYVTHDQEEAMTLGDRVVVMRDGIVQQCGTPIEVYQHPANRFVAGFVGMPPMNFFEGKIVADASGLGLAFDEGSGQLAIPDWARQALASKVGRRVVLGARAQAIRNTPFSARASYSLAMRVRVVEFMGDKIEVHLSTANHANIVAHVEPQATGSASVAIGSTAIMHFDPERLHFFEADGEGAAIAFGSAEPAHRGGGGTLNLSQAGV